MREYNFGKMWGCVPMNASQYFRTVINFVERLKVPADLTSPNTIEVQK